MAKKNLGNVELVDTIESTDSILAEIRGSVRRVSLSEVIEAENEGGVGEIACVVAGLIAKAGLGNAYIYLENSDEGDSVVTINGEAVTIPSGAVYKGYVDDFDATLDSHTHYLRKVVVIGDITGRLGSNSDSYRQNTLESVELYFSGLKNYTNRYMCYRLYACTNLVIRNLRTTNALRLVSACTALANLDVSTWDISGSNVLDSTFYYNTKIKELTGYENWDTAHITTMQNLFNGNQSLTSLDLSKWNTGNVTSMSGMFNDDSALVTVKLGDGWNMAKVTSVSGMFGSDSSLTTVTGSIRNLKISLSLSAAPLTRESALVFINGLSEDHEDGATLTLSSTTKALLTDDDIKIATDKGWTIA